MLPLARSKAEWPFRRRFPARVVAAVIDRHIFFSLGKKKRNCDGPDVFAGQEQQKTDQTIIYLVDGHNERVGAEIGQSDIGSGIGPS